MFGRVIGLGLDGEKQLSLGLANTWSLPSLASTWGNPEGFMWAKINDDSVQNITLL